MSMEMRCALFCFAEAFHLLDPELDAQIGWQSVIHKILDEREIVGENSYKAGYSQFQKI